MISICTDAFKREFRRNLIQCLDGKKFRQLAKEIGLSEATISSYACGRTLPNLYITSLIANNLNVSLDYLIPRYAVKSLEDEIDPNQMSLL